MPNPSELARLEESWDEPGSGRLPKWLPALERLSTEEWLSLVAREAQSPVLRQWAADLLREGQVVEATF